MRFCNRSISVRAEAAEPGHGALQPVSPIGRERERRKKKEKRIHFDLPTAPSSRHTLQQRPGSRTGSSQLGLGHSFLMLRQSVRPAILRFFCTCRKKVKKKKTINEILDEANSAANNVRAALRRQVIIIIKGRAKFCFILLLLLLLLLWGSCCLLLAPSIRNRIQPACYYSSVLGARFRDVDVPMRA